MEKKKPKGKAIEISEAKSDETATPDAKDFERADELASIDPLLKSLWEAEPEK